jgi:hypothetical protein
MGSYEEHQNLIKRFKLDFPKVIPEMRVFDRHVGLFYRKNGVPVKINKKGMADLYGIIKFGPIQIHIEIEAKTGKSVQSKDQKIWQSFIEKFGGKYFIMRDSEQTIKEVRKYIDDCFQIVYK